MNFACVSNIPSLLENEIRRQKVAVALLEKRALHAVIYCYSMKHTMFVQPKGSNIHVAAHQAHPIVVSSCIIDSMNNSMTVGALFISSTL